MMYPSRITESSHLFTIVRLCVKKKSTSRFIPNGFPDKVVTKKPAETRMGKGKGDPAFWVCVVKRGRILFEMEGVTPVEAKAAMRLASDKLPIKCQYIERLPV